MSLKESIKDAIREIAQRKPGRSKLVYDRATRTILVVDPLGLRAPKPSGLIVHPDDADMFQVKARR